jgi:hypothetical protein
MRKFHIQKINKYLKDQAEATKKAQKQQEAPSNKVFGPNIKPSSTYNFKK